MKFEFCEVLVRYMSLFKTNAIVELSRVSWLFI